jgi:hypothetical protein
MIDLNIGVKHLAFDVNQEHIWATHLNLPTSEVSYVTREVYVTIITQVEAKCKGKISCLLNFMFVLIYPLNILNFRLCFAPLSRTKLDWKLVVGIGGYRGC